MGMRRALLLGSGAPIVVGMSGAFAGAAAGPLIDKTQTKKCVHFPGIKHGGCLCSRTDTELNAYLLQQELTLRPLSSLSLSFSKTFSYTNTRVHGIIIIMITTTNICLRQVRRCLSKCIF